MGKCQAFPLGNLLSWEDLPGQWWLGSKATTNFMAKSELCKEHEIANNLIIQNGVNNFAAHFILKTCLYLKIGFE